MIGTILRPAIPRSTRQPASDLKYRVSVGRSHQRLGEVTTRDDAFALIREIVDTYGQGSLRGMALEVVIDGHSMLIGRDHDLLDLASATHNTAARQGHESARPRRGRPMRGSDSPRMRGTA